MSLDRLPEINNGDIKLQIDDEGEDNLLEGFQDKVAQTRSLLRSMANNSKKINTLKVRFTEQATSSAQEKGWFNLKQKLVMN